MPSTTPAATDPLKAYAQDLAAKSGAEALGPSDAQWLALATALHRLSTLTPEAREQFLDAIGEAEDAERVGAPGSPRRSDAPRVSGLVAIAWLARPGAQDGERQARAVLVHARAECASVCCGRCSDASARRDYFLALAVPATRDLRSHLTGPLMSFHFDRGNGERVKSEGKLRFILRHGVLRWGVPMAFAMGAVSYSHNYDFELPGLLTLDYLRYVIISGIVFVPVSFIFGWTLWKFFESHSGPRDQ